MSAIMLCPTEILLSIVAMDTSAQVYFTLRATCKEMHEKLRIIFNKFDWVEERAIPPLSTFNIDILSEIDALSDRFQALSLSGRSSPIDNLLITFPITSRGIPAPLITRILSHYKPRVLTLCCDKIQGALHQLRLHLDPTGVHITMVCEVMKMTTTYKEVLLISSSLEKTQTLWLTGEWVAHTTLSDEMKKIARPITQYVSSRAEWIDTMIEIDLQHLSYFVRDRIA